MELQNNIRALRVNENISQFRFATKLNISVVSLRTYEQNKMYPRTDLVVKMLDILGCEFWELYCKKYKFKDEKNEI